jgi:ferredoxin-NADP reductase
MIQQYKTQVIDAVQNTPSSRSVRFLRPQGFNYLPGQFIILSLEGENGEVKKPLSLSSSPTEESLEVTKRLTGHEFSNAFISLKKEDQIKFAGPYGNFAFRGEHTRIAMLSGGIGITPLLSMIRYCTDMKLPNEIMLFYSNREESDIPFNDELDELKRRNSNLTVINTLTRPGPHWTGQTGRIDANLIKKHIEQASDWHFYTSGPGKMVDSMLLVLKEIGVPDDRSFREYFPGYD